MPPRTPVPIAFWLSSEFLEKLHAESIKTQDSITLVGIKYCPIYQNDTFREQIHNITAFLFYLQDNYMSFLLLLQVKYFIDNI